MKIQVFVLSWIHSHMKKGALSVQRRDKLPRADAWEVDKISSVFGSSQCNSIIVQKVPFTSVNLKFSSLT